MNELKESILLIFKRTESNQRKMIDLKYEWEKIIEIAVSCRTSLVSSIPNNNSTHQKLKRTSFLTQTKRTWGG